jgi:hypothetical protein
MKYAIKILRLELPELACRELNPSVIRTQRVGLIPRQP